MVYTDLIFDLYGTLVDIHTEEDALVWEKTARFFSENGAAYTGSALQAATHAALTARKSEEGQAYECYPDIPIEEIFTDLFGPVENAASLAVAAAQLFRMASTEYIRLYPHVKESLAALRQKGRRLWLLSNAQAVFTRYELRHLGLENCFDGIYLSSDYRCRKPDSRFFNALLNGQALDPEKCLMIGNDRQTDIAGAKKLGIATLYMHTNLTPADQPCADGSPMEFEGSDWQQLTMLLLAL